MNTRPSHGGIASTPEDAQATTDDDLGQRVNEHRANGGKPTEGGESHSEIRGYPPITAPSRSVARTQFHPLRKASPGDILQRWADGETLKQIAESYSIGQSSLSEWLSTNVSKDKRELARELHYEQRLDKGLEWLEAAGDDPNLARAREPLLRRLEWRAERECGHRWAAKPAVAVQVAGNDLTVNLVSYSQQSTAALDNNPLDKRSEDDK